MNTGIIGTDNVHSVLTLIKEQFEHHFSNYNIIIVGPLLLQQSIINDLPDLTYEQYISKVGKIKPATVLEYFQTQGHINNKNLYVLPDLVYDLCFDRKLEKEFFLSSEDESQVHDTDECYLRTRKISHYAAVLLRNRNVPSRRSELIRMFEVENSYILHSNNVTIMFGAKAFMSQQGESSLNFEAYKIFYYGNKTQKSIKTKDVANTLQEVQGMESYEQIVILPDCLYDVYIRDPSKFDTPLSVTVFSERSLTFDPTENVCVPIHELCSPSEAKEIAKVYGVNLNLNEPSETRFPLLLPSEIIVKWLGFRRGDLIRIRRTNEFYYRMVAF